MAAIDTRLTCPWCTTRLNADASVCHGCGAIRARAPLSTVHLFFLHPLGAFALMLGGLALLQLPFLAAAALFALTWALFSILYVATRLRRRWMQVEPLLLEDEKEGPQLVHQAPAAWAPWSAGAATVATGLALIWMASHTSAVEPANAAVIIALAPIGSEVASSKRPPAPINVAAVAPPREALPPRSAPNPWPKAETTKVEPPRAVTAPVQTAKMETATIESPKVETAKTQTAPIDPAKAELPKTEPAADAQIMTAQRLLADLGYFSGTPDGKMGPKMRAAVKEFRADMSLGGEAVDGRLLTTLESVTAARQQAEARRSQQVEAKRAEPKRAEARQAEPQRAETRPAVTTPSEARPVEPRPVQQAEVIPAPTTPLPQTTVLSPPPLSVLTGLSAARAATPGQAPVRLAPLRQH